MKNSLSNHSQWVDNDRIITNNANNSTNEEAAKNVNSFPMPLNKPIPEINNEKVQNE